MKRENLDFLESDEIEKVMALYGKAITKKESEIENLKQENGDLSNKIETYEKTIKEFDEKSKDNAEWKTKYEELQTSISEQEAKRKAEKEEEILTNNINSLFEGKTFTSNYAKIGLTNDIKNALNNPENKGKGINEIFEELTKDTTDIFTNPNQVINMSGTDDSEQEDTKEVSMIW